MTTITSTAQPVITVRTWPRTSGTGRAALLRRVAARIEAERDELALIETLESGKPISQARDEISSAAGIWYHAASLAQHAYGDAHNALGPDYLAVTVREPAFPRSPSAATAPPASGASSAARLSTSTLSTRAPSSGPAPRPRPGRETDMYWAYRRVGERRTLPFSETTRPAAAVEVAAGKVARLAADYPDYFPLYTDQGRWKHGKAAWTNWREGFLGGQMWLLHELGLDGDWQARAEHHSRQDHGHPVQRQGEVPAVVPGPGALPGC